jgi:hypothetical protein
MTPVIASFYTPTWEYPKHAARLRRECDGLGLKHHIEERPDTGTYLGNTRIKPIFLLETLDRIRQPLLWVDVDASILREPSIPMDGHDWRARLKHRRRTDRTWHVGTLMLGNTRSTRAWLRLWIEYLDEQGSDELAFDRAWQSGRWTGFAADLPPEYFVVEGRRRSSTVILHRLSKSASKREYHRGRR